MGGRIRIYAGFRFNDEGINRIAGWTPMNMTDTGLDFSRSAALGRGSPGSDDNGVIMGDVVRVWKAR